MKQLKLYFKGFNRLFGRAPKSSLQKQLEAVETIRKGQPKRLSAVFGEVIDTHLLRKKPGERNRAFTRVTVFWAALGQVFWGGSCRAALQEIQQARMEEGLDALSASTSSYCTAKKERMDEVDLKAILVKLGKDLADQDEMLWRGRRIYAVDGTGVALADTHANQEEYPQPSEQKSGCGFPVMQLVVLQDLASGAMLDFVDSPLNVSETSMFCAGALFESLPKDSVMVFDRHYCSYLNIAQMLTLGIHSVSRLHQGRKVDLPKGVHDKVVEWTRPPISRCPDYISREQWQQMPQKLHVRYIRISLQQQGFRPENIIIATTLLDEPADQIAALFLRRWRMEMCFADLKTTLGMDNLMFQSPEMARKMVIMYFIAHNLIRWTLMQAASRFKVDLDRLSFKASLDVIHHFKDSIYQHKKPADRKRCWIHLLRLIANDPNPLRPSRSEPRVIKRRMKGFPLLTKPRSVLKASLQPPPDLSIIPLF